MQLARKIKALRYQASLTQEQLAEKLSVSPQAVSKWETAAAMPDISLLPLLAETFGISIDELFDLTDEQKLRRIQNRMNIEEELSPDVFKEYEEFLQSQGQTGPDRQRALSLLAHLYHHRLQADAKRTARLARQAILLAPEKKDCQWLLQNAEGGFIWDWNTGNHAGTIAFYRQVIASDTGEPKTPLPYFYLIDNLIADRRTEEAKEALRQFAALPTHRPMMVPVYEAAIALAEFDEQKADAIMENALEQFGNQADFLFETAQYYARKCQYDKAVHYYEASFNADSGRKPRFPDALQGIAVIREILGDKERAIEAYERIISLFKTEWGFEEELPVRQAEREILRLINA